MNHSYEAFEKTALWKAIDGSILDLEKNNDLKLSSAREHIIGYLCQQLVRKNLIRGKSFDKK